MVFDQKVNQIVKEALNSRNETNDLKRKCIL